MFGMGFTEIVLILIVAILFLGPDKLPEAMVNVAKFFRNLKRVVNEAKSTFEEEVNLKELKEEALHYRQSLAEATSSIEGFKHSLPNPAQEINKTLQEARRDTISLNDSSFLDDDFDDSPKNSKDDSKSNSNSDENKRPTEFKNLKKGS